MYNYWKGVLQDDKFNRYGLPILLVLFSFFLNRSGLTANSIALDEPFSIYVAQYEIGKIIAYLSTGNNPPLFEIILHYWIKIFGIKPSSVRFLPCLFTSLTALYVFKITLYIATKRSALIAFILFTLSNYELYFAHEARVYSLFTFLTCVSFYYFFKIYKNKTRINFLIFGLVNLLLIYAHYFCFFVLFVQFVSIFIFNSLRLKCGKELFYVGLFLSVGYLPYIVVFIQRFYESSAHGTWISPVTNLGQLHHVITLLTNNSSVNFLVFILLIWTGFIYLISNGIKNQLLRNGVLVLSIFFLFYSISIVAPMPYYWEFSSKPWAISSYLIFIILGTLWIVRSLKINALIKMTLLWFILPLLIMFISSFKIPMFIDRYYIYVTPAFFILIAILSDYLSFKSQIRVYYILIALLLITHVRNEPNNRDVKPMIEKIASLKTSSTAVILCPDYFNLNFTYYYSQKLFENIGEESINIGLIRRLQHEKVYGLTHINQLDSNVLFVNKKIIYLDASADFVYPLNGIKKVLNKHYHHTETLKYGDAFNVFVFEK